MNGHARSALSSISRSCPASVSRPCPAFVASHNLIFTSFLSDSDCSEKGEKKKLRPIQAVPRRDRRPSSLVSLVTRLCAAQPGKQSRPACAESHPPPPTFPLSLFSPYCPLAHFPQCYKLQTTQTSRPNALPWTPSKLHFLESQEAGFIDNTGHTVRLPPFCWQREEKPKTGPSQAQKTPALFYNQLMEPTFLKLRQR